MRNVSDPSFKENKYKRLLFNNFFSENRAIYEIMWKILAQQGRVQMKV
jgi:hypothetical protein